MRHRHLGSFVFGLAVATILAGCHTEPPATPDCTIAIEPSGRNFAADGGTATLQVAASSPQCEWTASATASWVALVPPTGGVGSGAVSYTVASNAASQERSAAIVVGTVSHTVTQAGRVAPPCEYAVVPTDIAVPSGQSSVRVDVSTTPACSWQVVSDASWIAVLSAGSGSGSGVVDLRVDANRRETVRTGTVVVAGVRVTVTQAGETPVVSCDYAVAPVSFSPCMAGGVVTTRVTTSDQCPWTVSSSAPWLNVLTGAGGAGPADVRVEIGANFDAPRQGVLFVRWPSPTAGENVYVTQAGCRYAVSRSRFDVGASGTSATFDVLQQSDPTECGGPLQNGCIWSAVSTVDWVVITNAMPRAGDDRVSFTVQPNATGLTRTGRITVRDQAVEVVQAGL